MASNWYDKGLALRKEILGEAYVEKQLREADDFNQPLQEMVTEYCWGWLWNRPGLPKKTRSMLNLALLATLNRHQEFKTHVKGALKNGCTRGEISEVLLQVAMYSGIPAGVEAFRLAREAFRELEASRN